VILIYFGITFLTDIFWTTNENFKCRIKNVIKQINDLKNTLQNLGLEVFHKLIFIQNRYSFYNIKRTW
jgi:hypothetical protein